MSAKCVGDAAQVDATQGDAAQGDAAQVDAGNTILLRLECTVNIQAIYGLLRTIRTEIRDLATNWHDKLQKIMSVAGLAQDHLIFSVLELMPERQRARAFEDKLTITIAIGNGKNVSGAEIASFKCDAELGVVYKLLCELRSYLKLAHSSQWIEKFERHLAHVNMPNSQLTFHILESMPADVRVRAFEECFTVSVSMQL